MMNTRICAAVAILLATVGCPPCPGPDPRAVAVEYTLLSTVGPSSGNVRITGVVTNRGVLPFLSSEGQQSVQLYEGDSLVAEQEFTNLGVGASVEVQYERLWSTLNTSRPQAYTLRIVYDPDIFIDGNDSNDDCNIDNNARSRDTDALDAFFD